MESESTALPLGDRAITRTLYKKNKKKAIKIISWKIAFSCGKLMPNQLRLVDESSSTLLL